MVNNERKKRKVVCYVQISCFFLSSTDRGRSLHFPLNTLCFTEGEESHYPYQRNRYCAVMLGNYGM
jgi:hypothetical protein